MVIGTNSAGLTLSPTSGPIVIDQIAGGGAIQIGNALATSVQVGRAGVTTIFPGPLSLPGLGVLSNYEELTELRSVDGAIPLTANILSINYQKINSLVRLTWRWTGATVVATAATTLTVTSTVPVTYRPAATAEAICEIFKAAARYPGYVSLSVGGNLAFQFMGPSNGGTINYAIGEAAGLGGGTISYSTV